MKKIEHFQFRPVKESDIPNICALAAESQPGLTSLSKDPKILKELVYNSIQSFSKLIDKPHNEFYFFVLEDTLQKKVIGTSGIFSQIGVDYPFYNYKVTRFDKTSELLNKTKHIQLLELQTITNGPSEIGALYLQEGYRKGGLGRLLSLSRFLFISLHPERFKDTVIAEMRGVSDAHGKSPFWDSLGTKFFDMEFEKADYLSSKNKTFIGDLMPQYPIYTEFLSKEANQSIGNTHPYTKPALELLKKEGFQVTDYIDIFDGGPKIKCPTKNIRSIQESHHVTIHTIQEYIEPTEKVILSNTNLDEFISGYAHINRIDNTNIEISQATAKNLEIKQHDTVLLVTPYPNSGQKK